MNIRLNFFLLSVLIASNCAANSIIDQTTQSDLDIVRKDRKTLGDVVNNTITISGRKRLDHFLLNPTVSLDTLAQRQQFLSCLIANNALYSSLEELLGQLPEHEVVMHNAEDKDPIAQKALERVYFSLPLLKRYNTSPYALYLGYVMHVTGLCAPLVEHIVLHLGIDLLAHKSHCSHHGHDHHHGHNHDHGHRKKNNANLTYYGLQTLHWALHVPGLYEMGSDIKHRALMMKYLQNEMIHVSHYIKRSRDMYMVLKKHDVASSALESYIVLNNFFGLSAECSDSCKRLLALLESGTFTGSASVWNNAGNVLAAYHLYRACQDELLLLVQAIGEIDVWVGSARLLKNKTEAEPWCFVTFSSDESPRLIAKNVRHLFINKDKIRTWDVSTDKGNHTFITGDNGSGKSTYLNGTGHAIILAQTLGIVPAESFQIKPFAQICTYRFIEDNIFEGTSRFYAECARIDTILKAVANSLECCCVLLDEPFTSTHRARGSQYLKQILSNLFTMNHVVSFTTTHYGSVDTLVDDYEMVNSLHLS